MLINVVIICIIHSASALFHHSKLPLHSKFHLHGGCHTAPLTLFKVLKNIHACQYEVKNSIFHEAFSLIKEHAFHHPHESHSLNVHDLLHAGHNDHDHGHEHHFADRNFTLTEQEILRFFEENDHASGTGFSFFDHDPGAIPVPNTGPPISPDYPDYHEPDHSIYNHRFLHADSPYKKADEVAVNEARAKVAKSTTDDVKILDLPQDMPVTPKKTDYTYFNVRTAKALEPDVVEQMTDDQRRSGAWLHPTTATFKDKRIAGCLMHCLYEKDNAVDPHTGFPTLDGLVHFHSDGVHEHGFFMATLRAADSCLKGAANKYHIEHSVGNLYQQHHSPHHHHHHHHHRLDASVTCDLSFDIFDCVSDAVTDYCNHHNHHHDYDPYHHHHGNDPLHHHHHDYDPLHQHHHDYDPYHHHYHAYGHHGHHPDSAYDYFHSEETPFIKK